MSTYFRSEEMSLCQIYIKLDTTYSCISELGEVGLAHFNNLNESENVHRLKFIKQLSDYSDMQRIIRYIRHEAQEAGIDVPDIEQDHIPPAPQCKDMIELRSVLGKMETDLLDITRNYNALKMKYINSLETSQVLEKADGFFLDASSVTWSDSLTKTLLLDTNDFRGVQVKKEESLKLGYLTGSIPCENFFAFERILWRVCRGNFFIRHVEMDDEGNLKKFVFMVFFQGDVIEKKIRLICQGFRTSLYQCPESAKERFKHLNALATTIKDLQIVLEQTDYHRRRLLFVAAANLSLWRVKVMKVMAVYYIMNHLGMDEGEKYFIAECWIPKKDMPLIQHALYQGSIKAGSSVNPILTQIDMKSKTPPTYNRTNHLTYGFQMLIDAYGIGNYRELNPAPYTIVTFPFLFAVMFGDIGHGLLVSLFATWMVLKEKMLSRWKNNNEIWSILFAGRYIILAMGLFSIYTGLIYNEIFSKSLSIFQTAWKSRFNVSTVLSNNRLQLNPETAFDHSPHIFGIDPVWDAAGESAIVALNSVKMKVAIILGVLHMFFGLSLASWNHIFFGNYIDLVTMCIPQMIFFSLFLYLAVLILLKWGWYAAVNKIPYNSLCAPSILIIFIDMVLCKDSCMVPDGCQRYMFKYQGELQKFLMTVILLCVPVMLTAKPFFIVWRKMKLTSFQKPNFKANKKRVRFANNTKHNNSDEGLIVQIENIDDQSSNSSCIIIDEDSSTPKEEWHDQDISEVFIIQGIRTLECVLGSVSHTASYLRLWALSLAHDQLSSVLWNMVLRKGLQFDDWKGGILLVFAFLAWSLLTVAILVVMEGLSAFLHTLRLHWVEFQSKFYAGTGVLFQPFDFKKVSALDEDKDE